DDGADACYIIPVSRHVRSALLLAALVATMAGCIGLLILPSPPHPNVTLPKRSHRLQFEIGPGVCDCCTLPAQQGFAKTTMEVWLPLLETAFRLGIAPSFHAPKPYADLTLRLVRAEPHVTVSGRLPSGDALALISQIRYEAQLLDAGEHPLTVTSGDA